MINRNAIRKQMREKRGSLAQGELATASQNAANLFLASELYQQSQHIGFYIAHNGELDPASVLTTALADGKTCYLPTLDPISDNKLIYVHYTSGESLVINRYNIPEPIITPKNVIGGKTLDLVLVPLVSFDLQGNRLGMGKGYYDRTFEFKKNPDETDAPLLVGFAHQFQLSDDVAKKEWDVPMDYVVTDTELYSF